MAVLGKHFFKNLFGFRDPAYEIMDHKGPGVNMVSTINYPEERKPYPPGYRGMHRLVPRMDGRPRCVACYMCATACPAQCIYIEAGEYEDQAIEKYPVRFEIDELRCIVCGFCVEACPKDAIRMDTGTHAPAVLSPAAGGVRQGSALDRTGGGAPHRRADVPRAAAHTCAGTGTHGRRDQPGRRTSRGRKWGHPT